MQIELLIFASSISGLGSMGAMVCLRTHKITDVTKKAESICSNKMVTLIKYRMYNGNSL